MIPISAENASFLLQFVLPTVKNEHKTTRSVIEAIPSTHADYKPDADSKTAMEIAWHVVAAEQRFYGAVIHGEFDFTPIHKPETVVTPAQVGEWYGASFAKSFDAMCNLNGEHLAKIVNFRDVVQRPAVSWIFFSLNHVIHHRGQLTTYLRAMGGKVPAVYGESHDSAAAKKAAQA
jgi:uncharacterized damage-inducible protein DinB